MLPLFSSYFFGSKLTKEQAECYNALEQDCTNHVLQCVLWGKFEVVLSCTHHHAALESNY